MEVIVLKKVYNNYCSDNVQDIIDHLKELDKKLQDGELLEYDIVEICLSYRLHKGEEDV